jgi:hypothetical protein
MDPRKVAIAGLDSPEESKLRRRAAPSRLKSNIERLDSWKQIAVYLNREVRTVQRWEKREGLPVHRHTHLKGSTVYAFKTEIDVWLTGRGQTQSEAQPMPKQSKYTANGLNPPPSVMKQMVAAFRLWLAMVELYQNCSKTLSNYDFEGYFEREADSPKLLETLKRSGKGRKR